MADIHSFKKDIQSLVRKFEQDKNHYLQKGYNEAQVRIDFLNPLFEALGWDIENKDHKPPDQRDVVIEKLSTNDKRVSSNLRPDYSFRVNGNTKFFVEAKAPSVELDDVNHIMQSKSYAWTSQEVFFVVLTDFEEFKLFDASLKPNPKYPKEGLLFDFKYTDYLDKIEKLWELSKERVEQGSLEALLPRDAKSKRLRIPPDKAFLEDLTIWRKELASDVHKRNQDFDINILNDVVQKILDRIIFIRIAEDRKIIDRVLWDTVGLWRAEGKRKSIMTHLVDLFREINDDLNGDIFKPHACENANVDSALIADIIENLYLPKSIYRFDKIKVELLGSIYERYLGSTIRVTPQRVYVDPKPEVKKAGGVYYTPKFIVDYIVKNTVGRLIEGKTPRQIEKIKILDPACGSGSFLLGAYQYLIDHHIQYYRDHPKDATTLSFNIYMPFNRDDFALPIHEKAKILKNNIFGIDIDPQAVEITMMSLYLKALEGERGMLPRKQHLLPALGNNIKCGNSLIGYDILDQGQLFDDGIKAKINLFDWKSKGAGFGELMVDGGFDVVIGNPPWGADFTIAEKTYLMTKFENVHMRTPDSFNYFLGMGLSLLRDSGAMGMIVPNNFLFQHEYAKSREYFAKNFWIRQALNLGDGVFDVTAPSCIIVVDKNNPRTSKTTSIADLRSIERKALPSYMDNIIFEELNIKDILATPDTIIPMDKKASQLISRVIKHNSILLGTLCEEVAAGIGTGGDKVFRIENKLAKKLSIEKDILSPVIVGRDINAYYTPEDSEHSIIYSTKAISAKSHPHTLTYLKPFQTQLSQKRETKKGLIPWWSLHWPRYPELFSAPKIILRQTADSLYASIDTKGYYCLNSIIIIRPRDEKLIPYLIGLLNSNLLRWIYKNLTQESDRVFAEVKPINLRKLPIHTIDFSNPSERAIHDKLVSLVDRMLGLHKKKAVLPPSAEREKVEREIAVTDEQINEIVYELYGVTEEEKKLIER